MSQDHPAAPVPGSLLDLEPPAPGEERSDTLLRKPGFALQRIVSRQHVSPDGFWYDQPRSEWVTVIAGRARLRFANPDTTVELAPGDFVEIPAGCRHRVEWTCDEQATIWLALHHDD